MPSLRAALVAAAVLAVLPVPVLAHVVSQPDSAVAGTNFTAGFLVGHGCNGSPTTALHVRLPQGVTAAKPLPKSGWTVTEEAGEIVWRGGSIDPHAHETFSVALTLPDTPGRTLVFEAVQECLQGTNRWVEVPAAGQTTKDLRFPAPFLTLTPRP